MSVEYSRRAIADLDSIATYYRSVADTRVSERFETRLRSIVDRIHRRPESSRPVSQRPGVRVALMISFPYKVFYRVIAPDRVRILHIRHTARRPSEE